MNRKSPIPLLLLIVVVCLLWPGEGSPLPVPDTKATAATYVYEKDQHTVPNAVLGAMNKLNRERGIVATLFEEDTTDGGGEVPEQYKVPVEAAKKAGLPALVVTADKEVLAVVKDPKTEEAVLEAVK